MTDRRATVLITTATLPPAGVHVLAMGDAATRRVTAKAALFFWAALGAKYLVVADATGCQLLRQEEADLLAEMGVALEQIAYEQDPEAIKRHGKGYGEGALLEFAVNQSAFLQQSPGFFKCTGKVFCRNFGDIFKLVSQNNIAQIFWGGMMGDPLMVDTRFFYTSRAFCTDHLIPAYKGVNDREGQCAEKLVYPAVSGKLKAARAPRPILTGFSGSEGGLYFDGSFGALDASFPCWVGHP